MQDSLLDDDNDAADLDGNEALAAAAAVSNFCHDNYDPDQDEIGEFRDSSRHVDEFKQSVLSTRCGKPRFFLLCHSLPSAFQEEK